MPDHPSSDCSITMPKRKCSIASSIANLGSWAKEKFTKNKDKENVRNQYLFGYTKLTKLTMVKVPITAAHVMLPPASPQNKRIRTSAPPQSILTANLPPLAPNPVHIPEMLQARISNAIEPLVFYGPDNLIETR